MKISPKKKYKFKIGHIATFLLMFLFFIGFAGFILEIIEKIRSGHGLDYYFTGYGVQMNYIGVLITLGVIPVSLFIGWIIKMVLVKKENWEIEKYKKARLLKKEMGKGRGSNL